MCMFTIGSSRQGREARNASLNASLPAIWKAMSFESTGCSLPSKTTALTSTTG